MKKTNKLIILILVETSLIVILSCVAYNKRRKVVVSPISKKQIRSYSTKRLEHFYEPEPNIHEIIQKDWLLNNAYITINKDALNERFNYPLQKEKGTYRIITVGDSFTFGDNIATARNWTERLEDELNSKHLCEDIKKYEVINLGMSGYDTEYEVERYRLRGIKYNPDLVIWTFGDLKRFRERAYELVEKLKREKKETIENEVEDLYGKGSTKTDNYEDVLFAAAMARVEKQMSQEDIVRYQKDTIKSFSEYFNGRLLYLEINFANIGLVYGIFNELVNKNTFFDRYDDISAPEFRLRDWHFNEKGHVFMKDNVIDTLLKKKLLPC